MLDIFGHFGIWVEFALALAFALAFTLALACALIACAETAPSERANILFAPTLF